MKKNMSRWSPLVSDLEPLSDEVSVPTATYWRRCTGFAERLSAGSAVLPAAYQRHVGDWLSLSSPDLRLHLVLKVGGKHRSCAWLGIGAAAATSGPARARATEAALDLGEALDSWGLFTDAPRGGPRLARQVMGLLTTQPNEASTAGGFCGGQLAVLDAIAQLAKRDTPLALSMEVWPGGPASDLVRELRTTQERAARNRPPSSLGALFFDPDVMQRQLLVQRLEGLLQDAVGGEIRIRMHGKPPRAILAEVLRKALSEDLGADVRFEHGPPAPIAAQAQPLGAVLGILGTGSEQEPEDEVAVGTGKRSRHPLDLIPF